MSEALYPYYERELEFMRKMAHNFAKQYPAVANRLGLETNVSTDPHVERLIQAFALIAGRIHHKLDDEFPELTDALLSVLYPHYLAPIPSVAMVQFDLDAARADLPEGFKIERHTRLRTQPVRGQPLRYRTAYPVTLWPLHLSLAQLQPPPFPPDLDPPPNTAAALRLYFDAQGNLPLSALKLETLRLFLNGPGPVTADLYELIFNNARKVVFRPSQTEVARGMAPVEMTPEECLRPVGFERDEGLLPYPSHSFPGYRLLTEFFAYPAKFLFVDVAGWQRVCKAGFQKRAEVVIFLDRTITALERSIDAGTFRIGCAPIVNLFEQTSEPIALTHAKHEYLITPDVAFSEGMEVYSVDDVTSMDSATGTQNTYYPFFSFHHEGPRETRRTFWYGARRFSTGESDRGTDVYLNLVDLDFDPRLPSEATIVAHTTCTNRNLPALLQQAGDEVQFELELAAPLSRLRCLKPPSPPLRPPIRRGAYWRLVSHLSLNHLSLTEGEDGAQALQELLRLYDFSAPESGQQLAEVTRRLIEGITSVASRRVVGRTGCETSSGFARGVEVTITFDEPRYIGTGAFLFASVLERFLGLYVSVNSFTQLVARTRQREGALKKWPPRSGDLALI